MRIHRIRNPWAQKQIRAKGEAPGILPRPQNRDIHPKDEDLSVGAPDLGHPDCRMDLLHFRRELLRLRWNRLARRGCWSWRRGGLGLGGFLLFGRCDDGVQNRTFHARHELDDPGIADVLDQFVDDGVAQFAMGHLAATEAKTGLDLVALVEEAEGLILFGLVIVLIDRHGELALFDRNDLLLFLGGPVALFLLVEEAAVVLDAADRGSRVGRNLDQVEAPLLGDPHGLKGGQDAELFAVFVDDADFARTNLFVDADKGLCRTFVECDGAPPKVVAARPRTLPGLPRSQERTLSIALARI